MVHIQSRNPLACLAAYMHMYRQEQVACLRADLPERLWQVSTSVLAKLHVAQHVSQEVV